MTIALLFGLDIILLIGIAVFISLKIALIGFGIIGAIAFLTLIVFVCIRFHITTQMLIMIHAVVLLVAVIGFFKYQGYQGFVAMKEGMAHMKQTVSTTKAVTSDWRSELEAVGSLRAAKGVDISNELSGIVEEIDFKSGDDVKQGALLIKLHAEDDIAKLETLKAAASIAEITYNRDKKQLKVQAVSQANVDNDAATLAGAVAQVNEQKAIVDKKFIRAPFSGHIGIRNIDVGQYLSPGTAIVTLQQLDPIYIDFNMPQQSLAQIQTGQKIAIKNDTYPGRTFEGAISAINSKVDTTTRNVQIRAELSNEDHALLPGMYATAVIAVGKGGQFVTLPQTCITYNPYGDTVFIVHDQKGDDGKEDLTVEQTFVTVGATRGDQVQILKGVKDGDTVVSAGQLKLQNGSAITVNNTIVPKNDANPSPQEQ